MPEESIDPAAQGAAALPAAVYGIAAGRDERMVLGAVVAAGLERDFAWLLDGRIRAEIKATHSNRGGATTYAVARPEVVRAFLGAALVLRETGRMEPQEDLLQFEPVCLGYATYEGCVHEEARGLWEAHLRQVAAPGDERSADYALTPAEAEALQAVLTTPGDALARFQAFANLLSKRVPWVAGEVRKGLDLSLSAAGGSEDELYRIAFALCLLGQR